MAAARALSDLKVPAGPVAAQKFGDVLGVAGEAVSGALEIGAWLGDEREVGGEVKCRCPLCGGRLALRDGDRGVLAKCWGGCDAREVYAELRRLGHITGVPPPPSSREEIERRKFSQAQRRRKMIAWARDLWSNRRPLLQSRADTYLVSRGIDASYPFFDREPERVLGFLPWCFYAPGIFRPALLARIDHPDHGHVAVQCTYLSLDGDGKTTLDPPRKFFGPCKGAAVRLGTPRSSEWLVVGEGVETTLSVMQSCALPGWAALSADGLRSVVLPDDARMVLICADRDDNATGENAARYLKARLLREGRRVKVALPRPGFGDFNDMLRGIHENARAGDA